jgi:hypothetical protein
MAAFALGLCPLRGGCAGIPEKMRENAYQKSVDLPWKTC